MPAPGSTVLFVSNDLEVSGIWVFVLRQMGLEATLVRSAQEAVDHWARGTFDLVLIDAYGPDLDGIDVVRQLRSQAVNPILMFTPDRDETHMLEAYRAGVDECVVKSVSPALFMAKVRAWLRRSWTVPASALDNVQAGVLCLDPARRVVTTESGSVVKLTNLEFRVLHLLMRHRGQVLPSDLIVDRVWGCAGGGDHVLLKNVIYRLRRKIEPDPHEPRYLQTVAGEGYVFYST
jgi:DNA-binding response OmpR family regulator